MIKSVSKLAEFVEANPQAVIYVSGGEGCTKCSSESTRRNVSLFQEMAHKNDLPFEIVDYDELDDIDEFEDILHYCNVSCYPSYICFKDGTFKGNRSGVGFADNTIEWANSLLSLN